ncbi:ATP-binding cassette domain-containing protein [Verrucomicrobiaceae bacterium R5-34]|uniref:ATP-binding cassette domain-containing protein n=1 Tax=Oceaniferula flava TaxID=2800421 RepID=A0AAE2VD57_9BACT|nr:ATP-binding cassette domain-containing protein [Oceaniferula flavus]MBK1829814.1 ATP-binding cassette domain-containing protein [Verrucomicrobiaceae bacterium R5-34]MBK1856380.1 ATP-binding cassette domain-containing protein [Oceaniferula flavus]MBM1137687.1 ATP-binding cassette domain-containing protein [Oceaniferula flavus]
MSVHLKQLGHRYGEHRALHDISLDIKAGEQVALIGPSGCGKTTLLRLIGTQMIPTEGSVEVLSQHPAELNTHTLRQLRHQIATIPQHLGLVPNVRVIRNVLNGGLGKLGLMDTVRQSLTPSRQERQMAHELLDRAGIGEKLYDRTDSLSGGQQQRVAVARALYQKPSIILADEPVSAVDPMRARDMIRLLIDLSKQEEITLIVSIHNLELAREFFPRLIGLRAGQLAFDSAVSELSDEQCRALYQLDHDA